MCSLMIKAWINFETLEMHQFIIGLKFNISIFINNEKHPINLN